MPVTKEDIRKEIETFISSTVRKELNNNGFPDYMILSFLKTARETKTIITSRLPGSAGVDLIENGYDLKGFHIKAKSCDWGPMAGFICRLPLLNKFGPGKVDYNTAQIGHYLKGLNRFKTSKIRINEINVWRKQELERLVPARPNYKVMSAGIHKKADDAIRKILEKDRKDEQETGKWSGENNIPDGNPFVPLQRQIGSTERDVTSFFKDKYGIVHLAKLSETIFYGIATNVTKGALDKATVAMEFILSRNATDTSCWQMYHGEIMYKDGDGFTLFIPDKYWESGLVTRETIYEYEDELSDIFQYKGPFFPPVDIQSRRKAIQEGNAKLPGGLQFNGSIYFYAIEGIMNPFPPYPTIRYKNAVSGDYDLFSFWPQIWGEEESSNAGFNPGSNAKLLNPGYNPGFNELIRKSEAKIGKQLRMGGKILSTFIGDKSDFAVEFIPGFKELDPAKDGVTKKIIPGEELKESAELGNISSLGELVQGTLNSFAAKLGRDVYGWKAALNKAFHSDEGGRPGIMEIEFPIAVFFPFRWRSKALDHKDPIENRGGIPTYGGLIKNVQELVILITECQSTYKEKSKPFLVTMHSEWMMHLFFISLRKEAMDAFLSQGGEFYYQIFGPISRHATKAFIEKKLNEFKTILKNLNAEFNQPAFESDLKKILQVTIIGGARESILRNDSYFKELRMAFLRMAFQPDRRAYAKRMEIEQLMATWHRIYENYPEPRS